MDIKIKSYEDFANEHKNTMVVWSALRKRHVL